MAMKKLKSDSRWRRLRPRREDTETTRVYTPQDHRALVAEKANGAGILRPDTGQIHISDSLEDISEGGQTSKTPRVVLVIMIAALAFIAVIAYFVSQMPKKD